MRAGGCPRGIGSEWQQPWQPWQPWPSHFFAKKIEGAFVDEGLGVVISTHVATHTCAIPCAVNPESSS